MPASAAKMKAQNKWIAKAYDRVNLLIRKDGEITKSEIQEHASAKGESLTQYILEAVRMRIEHETRE